MLRSLKIAPYSLGLMFFESKMKISIKLLFLSILLGNCLAIECNFRYTEDDKNYPEHIISSLVDRSMSTRTSLDNPKEFVCQDGDDVIDHENENGTKYFEFLSDRISLDETTTFKAAAVDDDSEAESLCCTKSKTIRPKTLPSVIDNKLVYVVNHGDYSQTVTIEECTDANKPCQFDENFPLGYTTKCKQKHQMHTIKALKSDRSAIVDETVYYPSGCDCKIYSSKGGKNKT